VLFPKGLGGKPLVIDLELEKPIIARSLVLTPARKDFATTCELRGGR